MPVSNETRALRNELELTKAKIRRLQDDGIDTPALERQRTELETRLELSLREDRADEMVDEMLGAE